MKEDGDSAELTIGPTQRLRQLPRSVRWYLASRRGLVKVFRAVQVVLDGVWLGALGRPALHALDAYCYERWPEYRQDEYNRSGLLDWETAVVESHFAHCRRILLIGAGGGREVLALSRLGYEVEAYECHPELVSWANGFLEREGATARVRPLERDAAPRPEVPCDGIVVGWGAYMLIRGRARRTALLADLRALVEEGTPLLLSFYHRAAAARRFALTARVANVVRRPLGNERVEVGDALGPNFVHHFTPAEVRSELEEARFEMVLYADEPYGRAVARAV